MPKLKVLIALSFLLLPSAFLFAQTEPGETLTIATYYPSPYGYYKNFDTFGETHLATEGGNVGIGTTTPYAKLDVRGQIYTERSVIFNPQTDIYAITGLSSPQIGEVVYNRGEDKFYYNNNGMSNSWVPLGGGGGVSFTYYCNFTGGTATTNICTNSGDAQQGYCPSGFKQIYDLGSWGTCYVLGCGSSCCRSFRPPGGGCDSGSSIAGSPVGEAYVCSQ